MENHKKYAEGLWKKSKEFREMIVLSVLKNKPMSAYELALFFTNTGYRNTIIKIPIKRLEKRGYITFTIEGKKKNYEITPKGIGALDEYRDVLAKFINYI